MRSSTLLSLAASLPSINAVFQGFNYGSTKSDGSTIRDQADFQSLFNAAKSLPGNSGFASARLYTTVQGGTANTPTSAIPAAIAENTSLLLGLWASGGQETITNEISALKTAIAQYGTSFTNLVAGISVGSEDLYRISPIGVAAKSGYGAEPDTIANYINQLRSALAGTSLSSAPIGHVDTWTAWVNGSNKAVIDACDWIGNDAYPYFQNTQSNGIENGASLFYKAMTDTKNAVGGKPVWITETGWPVSGRTSGFAETGISNAKRYWDEVGCPNFGVVNTWWFTLEDTDNNASPDPSFSIAGANPIGSAPLFDLSCTNVANTTSSVSSILASASALTGPPASSGSALAPSVDNGVGSLNPTMTSAVTASGPGLAPSGGSMGNLNRTLTGSGSYPTGSSGIPGSNNGTVPTVTTGSPGTKSSTVTSATQNAGAGCSRPVFGAVGALMVAVALR